MTAPDLHLYAVELRREQTATVYVLAADETEAEDFAVEEATDWEPEDPCSDSIERIGPDESDPTVLRSRVVADLPAGDPRLRWTVAQWLASQRPAPTRHTATLPLHTATLPLPLPYGDGRTELVDGVPLPLEAP